MQEKEKITLDAPLKFGGREVLELEMRSANIGDEEDALQMAVDLKRSQNPVTMEMCLFARLTGVPYDVLRSLPSNEYTKIRAAFNKVNSIRQAENPTLDLTQSAI